MKINYLIGTNMLKNTSDSRERQLEELKSFTDEINQEIKDIVGSLGWTMESVSNVVSIIELCLERYHCKSILRYIDYEYIIMSIF